jgi:hypothetical protein
MCEALGLISIPTPQKTGESFDLVQKTKLDQPNFLFQEFEMTTGTECERLQRHYKVESRVTGVVPSKSLIRNYNKYAECIIYRNYIERRENGQCWKQGENEGALYETGKSQKIVNSTLLLLL